MGLSHSRIAAVAAVTAFVMAACAGTSDPETPGEATGGVATEQADGATTTASSGSISDGPGNETGATDAPTTPTTGSDDATGTDGATGSDGATGGDGATGSDGAAGTGEAGASGDQFPITITHALGETVIESEPERVASVAWGNHESALALGVVPVIMEEATWGDDDGDGVLPWVEERFAELGVDPSPTYDPTDGIDFEAVADSDPDIILAAYSGLTQSEYDTLSEIAPVIAYPEIPWGATWREMTILNGTALGLQSEAEALVAELEQVIADTVADHPNVAGQGVLFSYLDPTDMSNIGFYSLADPRTNFLPELGLVTPSVVEETGDEFWVTRSSETVDDFADVDVLITYGNEEVLATAQADPLFARMPAVANGAVVLLTDDTPLAASANPSPLSIPTMLDDYLALIDAAAAKTS